MDVYKLRPEDVGFQCIDQGTFQAQTLRKEPWYQKNLEGKEVHYAVCPACNNPIQIIGLYLLPSDAKKPYGRHIGQSVAGLAKLDPEERDNCPYFKPRSRTKSDRRKTLTPLSRKILETLINQFDRVVSLLQKDTGINFSPNMLRKMLETYRAERGYLYTGATILNVPWIFAYMSDSQSIVGQYVRKGKDPDMIAAIKTKAKNATINDDGQICRSTKAFPSLDVCFIEHRESKDGDSRALQESMLMVVSTDPKHWVYEKVIPFDHQAFQRLVQTPDEKARRRMDLVEMAREVLGDLLP